jgi:8-oxo-dGTP pyrophosphatase MutT (NUDIX family)
VTLHADAVRELTEYQSEEPGQQQLRADYLAHLATHPDGMFRTCAPAHVTGSALVLDADTRRAALVLHPHAGLWLQPGGHCEPTDATLAAAALREATEETNIAGLHLLGGPVLLDRHPAPCRRKRPDVEHHLDVMYVALAPTGAEPVASEESLDAAWFAVDALPDRTDHAVRALVRAAVARAWASRRANQ